jgi:putative acetyltransferase
MIIRDETPEDTAAVRQLAAAAFGQVAEAELIEALRESGDAVISLVAEDNGQIVGHILLSRLQAPERCLGLAPVAVAPSRRNQGIGSDLVREGLAPAKRDGWQAVFVVGEPDYYGRFGFSAAAADKFETAYPKPYVLALDLAPGALHDRRGALRYASAFQALE